MSLNMQWSLIDEFYFGGDVVISALMASFAFASLHTIGAKCVDLPRNSDISDSFFTTCNASCIVNDPNLVASIGTKFCRNISVKSPLAKSRT